MAEMRNALLRLNYRRAGSTEREHRVIGMGVAMSFSFLSTWRADLRHTLKVLVDNFDGKVPIRELAY
jgi:hypothetical protein